MTFREVLLTIEGYNIGKKYLHDLLYRVTTIIASSGMNAKAVISKMNRLWPLEQDEEAKRISPALRKRIESLKKLPDAGRIKTSR